MSCCISFFIFLFIVFYSSCYFHIFIYLFIVFYCRIFIFILFVMFYFCIFIYHFLLLLLGSRPIFGINLGPNWYRARPKHLPGEAQASSPNHSPAKASQLLGEAQARWPGLPLLSRRWAAPQAWPVSAPRPRERGSCLVSLLFLLAVSSFLSCMQLCHKPKPAILSFFPRDPRASWLHPFFLPSLLSPFLASMEVARQKELAAICTPSHLPC